MKVFYTLKSTNKWGIIFKKKSDNIESAQLKSFN